MGISLSPADLIKTSSPCLEKLNLGVEGVEVGSMNSIMIREIRKWYPMLPFAVLQGRGPVPPSFNHPVSALELFKETLRYGDSAQVR